MWILAVGLRLAMATVMALSLWASVAGAQSAPSRPATFLLYFDAGSSRLSRNALSVVEEAARAIRRGQDRQQLSHVKVIGYSDTVGSVEGAQRLSERRAAAVREELLRQGIAANFVTVEGRGKKELAVPTGDQVNQPRNRRVRIVLYRPGD